MSKEETNELFKDLIGQNIAISLLSAILKYKKFAPAYLFAGPDGVGRSIAARRFLEGMITDGVAFMRERKRIEKLNHPDILWIEPSYMHQGKLIPQSITKEASINKKSPPLIRLEQIRDIKKFLSKQPIEAKLHMVVIEEAERMNEAAANALLKTLEEPQNGVLILICQRPENLLSTIRSRCQIIPFTKLHSNDLEKIYSKIQINEEIEFSVIVNNQELFNLANGSPGALIDNINTWNELPQELLSRLKVLPRKPIDALSLARDLIETLDIEQQLWLINWLQQYIWNKHRDGTAIKILESLRRQLVSFVQPRLAWEVALLKLSEVKD